VRVRIVLLWLLAIFVGVQFGAGWYEKLAVIPLWSDLPADQSFAAMQDSALYRSGRAFWPFVSPVVALLAVTNLVLAWRGREVYRNWLLAASALMTTYAVFSYGYFVPEMLRFQSRGDTWSDGRIDSFVSWWTGLNILRMAIGGAGWLCALRALSLSGALAATESPSSDDGSESAGPRSSRRSGSRRSTSVRGVRG
jgi:hypothetical protein